MAEEEGRKFGWWWSPFRGAQVFEVGVDDDTDDGDDDDDDDYDGDDDGACYDYYDDVIWATGIKQ